MNLKRVLLTFSCLLFVSVQFAQGDGTKKYKTENVVVLVMDGPRYSETWGDSTHKNIPRMANDMAQHGMIYTGFRNNGPTYTVSGHTAIVTGRYEKLENSGYAYPKSPSIFQYWLKATGKGRKAAYVISSKDKLAVLTNCKNRKWRDKYRPYSDCGINGLQTGYRSDAVTFNRSMAVLKTEKPNLVLINFKQPDAWGHAGNYEKYLSTMKDTDEYIYQIFKFLINDPHYKDKTTIFVTNDHGRHLDGRKNGFVSHGCNCEGCRRVNFFAYGPDIKKGVITDVSRELIDIPVTIGALMGFELEKSDGEIMTELFIDC